MSHFRLEPPPSYLIPHQCLSSNGSREQLPNFESIPSNPTRYSYDSTSLAPRRAAVVVRQELSETSPNSSALFEQIPRSTHNSDILLADVAAQGKRLRRNNLASRHLRTIGTAEHAGAHSRRPQQDQAYLSRLFSTDTDLLRVPVSGSATSLRNLAAAIKGGLAISPIDSISAAAAFESSLVPIQAASILPSPAQMVSLFNAPLSIQRASGLDIANDFSIYEAESARNSCTPLLLAYKEIDCARQYLEICSRYQDVGSVVEIGILTLDGNRYTFEVLPTISRKTSTHTLFLFRQLTDSFYNSYKEVYRPFVSVSPLPSMPAEPLRGQSRGLLLSSDMKMTLAKAVRIGLTDHGETINEMILRGRLDYLPVSPVSTPSHTAQTDRAQRDSRTIPSGIEGVHILRAAQRYTNTELHSLITASGSEVSYNSVTKRITNALKAQARHRLVPGEDLARKYEQMRKAFNSQRAANLEALVVLNAGRNSKKHSRSDSGWETAQKRRKTGGNEGEASTVRRSIRLRRSPVLREERSGAKGDALILAAADESERERERESGSSDGDDSDGSDYAEDH
ncbi:uncharacterized protein SEPMUDRAFT_147821 [Sphaerulina musiva SO2202]|uniref:Uncharacterized protein n=1 Tax=Sphaerulina musiva (strain SO2202) TaxID=692275 RepID=M3C7F6_SPHMS|nr:uncharacterized protein SEPMUDRAFT_147821 [Sphaerulina musiva SO2202]EMF16186.1 hypothetical protein SEPMUDRAFT_147821 [Sphaerulina musiva SO2202]